MYNINREHGPFPLHGSTLQIFGCTEGEGAHAAYRVLAPLGARLKANMTKFIPLPPFIDPGVGSDVQLSCDRVVSDPVNILPVFADFFTALFYRPIKPRLID